MDSPSLNQLLTIIGVRDRLQNLAHAAGLELGDCLNCSRSRTLVRQQYCISCMVGERNRGSLWHSPNPIATHFLFERRCSVCERTTMVDRANICLHCAVHHIPISEEVVACDKSSCPYSFQQKITLLEQQIKHQRIVFVTFIFMIILFLHIIFDTLLFLFSHLVLFLWQVSYYVLLLLFIFLDLLRFDQFGILFAIIYGLVLNLLLDFSELVIFVILFISFYFS